jgi:hypothetical protein
MTTFELPKTRLSFQAEADDPRFFDATQALLGQHFIDQDDWRGPLFDSEDNAEMRRSAVDEWSRAVRNGFVCC